MTTTTGLPAPPTARRPDGGRIRRVALLSVHTSPLAQPGVGDGGGLNVYVREVARRLGERGVAVDVFTRRSTPDTPDTVRVADRVRTHHLPAGSGGGGSERLPGRLGRLTDALEGHPSAGSHDLVHAHYWLSGWVAEHVAASWGVPFVQTFHTLGVLKNASLAPGDTAEPPLRLEVERRLATSADRVLGLTCGEARLLHETFGLSGSSIAVVPAGVDRDVFHPDGPPADPGLLPAGDGPLLLFVGRLQRLKGPDVAVRTLREVRRSLPGARLLIVGGASGDEAARIERPELAKLAAREGVADAVHLLPARPQEELPGLYRSADVVLVPSRSETFGLVALEAQACGTPVVGARVTGLEHVVGGGTLVDGHDPADHAAAAARLLTDEAAARGARRRALAEARRASWEATVDRLLDVYGRVAAGRSTVGGRLR